MSSANKQFDDDGEDIRHWLAVGANRCVRPSNPWADTPVCPYGGHLTAWHILICYIREQREANLKAQIEERRKQYEYYRNQLLTFEYNQ